MIKLLFSPCFLSGFKSISLTGSQFLICPDQRAGLATASALERSGYSAETLFSGLQVAPHPAFGITKANPHLGEGGLPQIYVPDFQLNLKPLYSLKLDGSFSKTVSKQIEVQQPIGTGTVLVTKSRGYDRPEVETKSGKAVKQKNATDEWDNFLGDKQTNIDPRDGLPDPDRIWSADGKRSIRFGEHEMNSKPNKLHYHQETWHDDKVENVLQRIPQ